MTGSWRARAKARAYEDLRPRCEIAYRMRTVHGPTRTSAQNVDTVVASLKRLATKRTRDGLARYGIPSDNALGVTIGGDSEAGEADRTRPRSGGGVVANRHGTRRGCWRRSWTSPNASRRRRWTAGAATSTTGVSATPSASSCSTGRRTPGARRPRGRRVATSSKSARGFVLMACLALHDREGADDAFLPVSAADRACGDGRTQLRQEGGRTGRCARSVPQRPAQRRGCAVSRRMAGSPDAAAKWVGKDALRQLTSPVTTRALRQRRAASRRKASAKAL